jgi:hypothetical protein
MISEAKVITIQVELDKLDETLTKYAPDAGFVEDIEAKARFLAPEAIGLVHSKRTPRVLCPEPGFCGYCGLIAAAEFSGYLIFASSVSALLHKMNERSSFKMNWPKKALRFRSPAKRITPTFDR